MNRLFPYEKPQETEPECTSSANSIDFYKKWFTAAGMGAIAAAIAHHFIGNARYNTPQVLWNPEYSYPLDLVCVNMREEIQVLFRDAMALCLDFGRDVQLRFETVTFFEENYALGLDAVFSATQHATMFAHRELLRKAVATRRLFGENKKEIILGCVFYQSTIRVNDEAVELQDCNANILKCMNGRRFHERHAVGFTIDGKGTLVRTYDVEGVLDTARALRRWGPRGVRDVSLEDVLRYSNVPSYTSFEPTVHSLKVDSHNIFSTQVVSHITTRNRTTAEPLFRFYRSCFDETRAIFGVNADEARTNLVTLLWRSPFFLFSECSILLRYSCVELGGYKPLSNPATAQVAFHSPVTSLMTSFGLKFLPKLWHESRAERSVVRNLSVLKYCGAFSIIWLFSSFLCTHPPEAVAYLSDCVVSFVGKMSGIQPLGVNVDDLFFYDAGKGAVCDLSVFNTNFTVLHAEHAVRFLSTLMSCMGIPLASVHLVVEVEPSHDLVCDSGNHIRRSALWPHTECHDAGNGELCHNHYFHHSKQYFISLPSGETKQRRMVKYFSEMNVKKGKLDNFFTTKTHPPNAADLFYVLLEICF